MKKAASDVIKLRGCFDLVMHDAESGTEVARRHVKNTVVTSGRAWVLNKIQSSSPSATEIGYMAVGEDTTAAATNDTALGNETDRNAVGTQDNAGTTASTPYWQSQTSWATNEANTTLAEVGLFDSSASGTMLARAVFTTLDKTTSNTLTISYTISN
jgi:hypothetical protein